MISLFLILHTSQPLDVIQMELSRDEFVIPHYYVISLADGWGDFYHGVDMIYHLKHTLAPNLFQKCKFFFVGKYDDYGETEIIDRMKVRASIFKDRLVNSKLKEFFAEIESQILFDTVSEQIPIHQSVSHLVSHNGPYNSDAFDVFHREIGASTICSKVGIKSSFGQVPHLLARDLGFSDSSLGTLNQGIFLDTPSLQEQEVTIDLVEDIWKQKIFSSKNILEIKKMLLNIAFIFAATSYGFDESFIKHLINVLKGSEAFKNKRIILFIKDPSITSESHEEDTEITIIKTNAYINQTTWENLQRLSTAMVCAGDKAFEEAFALEKYIFPVYHTPAKSKFTTFPPMISQESFFEGLISRARFEDDKKAICKYRDQFEKAVQNFQSFAQQKGFTAAPEIAQDIGRIHNVTQRHLDFWKEVVCPFVKQNCDYGKKVAKFHIQSDLLKRYAETKNLKYLKLLRETTTEEEYENTRTSKGFNLCDLPGWNALL
ncbi:MAG: hypothetical protein H6850_03675 [Alphaproteobacteria bacterium]|nr:MAG: hypothetical protein H6850_03675 [Alphaproteobacteria bacterium]